MTQKIQFFICLFFIVVFSTSQAKLITPKNFPAPSPIKRYLASTDEVKDQQDQNPAIWYYSLYKNKKKPNLAPQEMVVSYTPEIWEKSSPGFKFDFMNRLFSATTRDRSLKGHIHAACFTGDDSQLVESFFKPVDILNIDMITTTRTDDGKQIGISFAYADANKQGAETVRHFRISHCKSSGKAAIIQIDKVGTQAQLDDYIWSEIKDQRLPSSWEKTPPTEGAVNKAIGDSVSEKNGFDTYDVVDLEMVSPQTLKKQAQDLPRFQTKADFNRIVLDDKKDRPWKGMDISEPKKMQEFALLMQKYFYEGMMAQNPAKLYPNKKPNVDYSFMAEHNKQRYWCHMPWLNVTDRGRDAIHGLTKEMDLTASPIYPEAATTPKASGADWGVGFYNSYGCKTIDLIFGTKENPKSVIDISHETSQFLDGSVSAKILFTTATLQALEGAFQWLANVSIQKQTARAIRKVTHLQMDIAVKDSTLKGTSERADHWLMLTYYYDKDYTAPASAGFNLPKGYEGFSHMRPVGLQTGFTPKESFIFAGARTNSSNHVHHGADPQLLNGPADNPKSSCLGCHGAAGTKVPMAPGVKDFEQYEKVKSFTLDFSQQLALAKRNVQTQHQK